jgi:hypothetical protein
MELGRSEEANKLVAQAYGELRENHRRDRRSISILSRLLWAHWLLRAAQKGQFSQSPEELPAFAENNSRRWRCDPWSWMDALSYEIDRRRESHLERQNAIEPMFGQGHYRDHSADGSESGSLSDFLLLDGLSRTIGIPLRVRSGGVDVNLLGSDAEKIALFGGTGAKLVDLTLAIRSASSEDSRAIKRVFTRTGVACLTKDVVNVVFQRVLSAITHLRRDRIQGTQDQKSNALSNLRVFLEVAARLAVRVSSAQAKELFLLGVSIGQQSEMQHVWLFEAIGDLLTHALKSVPESEQGELLAKALAFPLQQEVMRGGFPSWPNPVIKHPHARGVDPVIDLRIAQLTAAVASTKGDSISAPLLRLLPLAANAGFLTQTERERLAAAIWGDSPEYQVLPETGLLPGALLLLPMMDPDGAKAIIRAQLYGHGADVLEDTQKELRVYPSPEIRRAIMIYDGMANAAANEAVRLLPTEEQALTLFNRLVIWRPSAAREGAFQIEGRGRESSWLKASATHYTSRLCRPSLTRRKPLLVWSSCEPSIRKWMELEQRSLPLFTSLTSTSNRLRPWRRSSRRPCAVVIRRRSAMRRLLYGNGWNYRNPAPRMN